MRLPGGAAVGIFILALTACAEDSPRGEGEIATLDEEVVFVFPSELNVTGVYPSPANDCRQLGESPAIRSMARDGKVLVACPSPSDATALGGEIVGKVKDVPIVAMDAAP